MCNALYNLDLDIVNIIHIILSKGGAGNWTSEGCETVSSEGGVVSCHCSHLTNFAILVVSKSIAYNTAYCSHY